MRQSNCIDIPWIRAIDEALVNNCISVANVTDSYEEAKAKLELLIQHEIDLAKYFSKASSDGAGEEVK